MNVSTKVYTTVTALGADAVYSSTSGMLYMTGFAPIVAKGIKPDSKIVAPVTGVGMIQTLTADTSQNSTQFGLAITFYNKQSNKTETRDFYFTSNATMTPTEVHAGFIAQINALSNIMPITASGTTTLVLTAGTTYAPYYQFSVANISSCAGTWGTSFSSPVLTAAVIPVGRGIDIKAAGQIDSAAAALVVDASYYGQAIINYNNATPGGSAQEPVDLISRNFLYVLAGVSSATIGTTDYHTLLGTYGTLTTILAHRVATWTASTGNPAYAQTTGVITLTTDTFPSTLLTSGDFVLIGSTTTLAVANVTEVLGVITVSTAVGSNTSASGTAAAGYYVKYSSL